MQSSLPLVISSFLAYSTQFCYTFPSRGYRSSANARSTSVSETVNRGSRGRRTRCTQRNQRQTAFSSFSLTYEGYQESLPLWNSKGQVDLGILLGIGDRSFPDGARGQAKRTANAPLQSGPTTLRLGFSFLRGRVTPLPRPPDRTFRFSICFCYPRNRVIPPVSLPPSPPPPLPRLSFSFSHRPPPPGRFFLLLLLLFVAPLRRGSSLRNGSLTFAPRSLPRHPPRDFIV